MKRYISIICIVLIIILAGCGSENEVKWAMPSNFYIEGRRYFLSISDQNKIYFSLPEGFEYGNTISAENKPEYNMLQGAPYYADPDDPSVVYVYYKAKVDNGPDQYAYFPYAEEK